MAPFLPIFNILGINIRYYIPDFFLNQPYNNSLMILKLIGYQNSLLIKSYRDFYKVMFNLLFF